jgi:hypothetical protein
MLVKSEVFFRPVGKLVMTGHLFCRQNAIMHRREICFCGEAAVCLARYMDRWVHVLTEHLSTFSSSQPDGMQGKYTAQLPLCKCILSFPFSVSNSRSPYAIYRENDCRKDGRTSPVVLVTFTEGMCWNNDVKQLGLLKFA